MPGRVRKKLGELLWHRADHSIRTEKIEIIEPILKETCSKCHEFAWTSSHQDGHHAIELSHKCHAVDMI